MHNCPTLSKSVVVQMILYAQYFFTKKDRERHENECSKRNENCCF